MVYFNCSVGEAEVPESVRAVAAGHRGERTQFFNFICFVCYVGSSPDSFFQEEYEDSSGNVVNKKTYEDLKRQGLL